MVHAPALGKTWSGYCHGDDERRATLATPEAAEREITCRTQPAAGATIVASRRHGSGEELDNFLADYKVADRVSAGSSLKFCLVASAEADLYPRFGRTMEWDTAAGHAVLLAAGGQVLTMDGEPLEYQKPGYENPIFTQWVGRAKREMLQGGKVCFLRIDLP